MRGFEKNYPINQDHNSGDPLGVSVCQVVANDGRRVTASSAYLDDAPPNLTIRTNAAVEKVLFENKKAVGVVLAGGEKGLSDRSNSSFAR